MALLFACMQVLKFLQNFPKSCLKLWSCSLIFNSKGIFKLPVHTCKYVKDHPTKDKSSSSNYDKKKKKRIYVTWSSKISRKLEILILR